MNKRILMWALPLVAVLPALAPPSARAQPDAAATAQAAACWAANHEERTSDEGLPTRHARHQTLHAAMDVLEALLRPNPGLLALPEVRLRMSRAVNGAVDPRTMPREAVLHAHGFGPKTWTKTPCGIHEQAAERLRARAGMTIFINTPTVTLNRWEHDEQLTTYLGQPATPAFQGWPTYGECAIVSADRRLPWVAVTVGEMLALFERRKQRELADWDQRHAGAFEPFDLAAMERRAEALRAQSPQAADAMLLGARERKKHEAAAHAALRAQRQRLADDAQGFRQALASMSAGDRAAPYVVGTGASRLPTAFDLRQARPVFKLDPGFPWDAARDRSRIQLITVCAGQLERNPAYHVPMRAAVAALDFARIAALLN
ncbi:MAG: hypothetical protein ACKVQR_07700 [Aquabacterium sp.]